VGLEGCEELSEPDDFMNCEEMGNVLQKAEKLCKFLLRFLCGKKLNRRKIVVF